jgi:hypothetical protein
VKAVRRREEKSLLNSTPLKSCCVPQCWKWILSISLTSVTWYGISKITVPHTYITPGSFALRNRRCNRTVCSYELAKPKTKIHFGPGLRTIRYVVHAPPPPAYHHHRIIIVAIVIVIIAVRPTGRYKTYTYREIGSLFHHPTRTFLVRGTNARPDLLVYHTFSLSHIHIHFLSLFLLHMLSLIHTLCSHHPPQTIRPTTHDHNHNRHIIIVIVVNIVIVIMNLEQFALPCLELERDQVKEVLRCKL